MPEDKQESNKIPVPRGIKGLPPLVLDMREVYEAEDRIKEIALANPMTLPELLSVFNLAYIRICKMVSAMSLEAAEAEMSVKQAKSIAMLDKVEEVIAARKQKSSADLRAAIVELDPDVREAQSRLNILEATVKLLQDKAKAMEMAYHAAKKVSDVRARIPDGTNYGGSK